MRVLPYLAVALLFAVTAAGVTLAVNNAFELDRGLLEETRTPVPGSRVLELDGRKYNLFYEAEELPESGPPPFRVRIRPVGSDRLLDLDDYSGSFDISGGREATAFATVRVPRSGRYRVTTEGDPAVQFREPAVLLGEPVVRRIVRIVASGVLALFSFTAGVILLVVTLVRRSRRR
jgi:hypothetical protein